MRQAAFGLVVLASACATYAPNPNDPVDMAAELGNRGRYYMAMGEVCDTAAGGQYRQMMADTIGAQQQRLGVLSDLVDRAYRARASAEHAAHLQAQMRERGYSAAEYCSELTRQAEAEARDRAMRILATPHGINTMDFARQVQEPAF